MMLRSCRSLMRIHIPSAALPQTTHFDVLYHSSSGQFCVKNAEVLPLHP